MLASLEPVTEDVTWSLIIDNAFTLTLLFIFFTAVVVTLLRLRAQDKCLALLDDFHVTFSDAKGHSMWGDLVVAPKGLEILFDAPRITRGGLTKTSAFVYEQALAQGLGLCRPVDGLTDRERKLREVQIRRSFRPGPVRRFVRWLATVVNALRDALGKAFNLLVGQLAKTDARAKQLAARKQEVDELRDTLGETVARAYEPLLERQIGKPVILRVSPPMVPGKTVELPGYLVDYTNDYVAVFNVVHEPHEDHRVELTEDHEGPGFAVEWRAPMLRIRCTGPEVVVVKSAKTQTDVFDLDCALLWGSYAEINVGDAESVALHLSLTRRVDVVCPRAHAVITHGGDYEQPERTRDIKARNRGAAPG